MEYVIDYSIIRYWKYLFTLWKIISLRIRVTLSHENFDVQTYSILNLGYNSFIVYSATLHVDNSAKVDVWE